MHVPRTDWINNHDENYRDGTRRLMQRGHGGGSIGHNHLWRKPNQFLRIVRRAVRTCTPAIIDLYVAPIGPTQFLQLLSEGHHTGLPLWIIFRGRNHYRDASRRHLLLGVCLRWQREKSAA